MARTAEIVDPEERFKVQGQEGTRQGGVSHYSAYRADMRLAGKYQIFLEGAVSGKLYGDERLHGFLPLAGGIICVALAFPSGSPLPYGTGLESLNFAAEEYPVSEGHYAKIS